jgi:hypothetical protein
MRLPAAAHSGACWIFEVASESEQERTALAVLISNARDLFLMAAWAAMWVLGGWWIVRSAFNLYPREQALAGFGVGLVLQNWLANFAGQLLPVPLAFWVSAGLVFLIGLGFSMPFSRKKLLEMVRIPIQPWQWLSLIGLTLLLTVVGRGMAILDDYQNLPTTSLIATGDIPPHFALDPQVSFNYHYFSLLFAGQLMRVGDLFVWSALDVTRALGFSIALMLGYFYVRRLTRSEIAGFISVLMGLFSCGTRWLMLLLPKDFMLALSSHIQMIGTAAGSGPTLY